jgi:hypothetical protein
MDICSFFLVAIVVGTAIAYKTSAGFRAYIDAIDGIEEECQKIAEEYENGSKRENTDGDPA